MENIEQLIENNMGLVYKAVNSLEYIPCGIDKEELIQIGKIELWQCIVEYHQEERKITLSTFSYTRIYYEIIDELRKAQAKKRNGVIYDNGVTDDFEERVVDEHFLEEVKHYLDEFDYKVFHDKYFENLSIREISEKHLTTAYYVKKSLVNSKQLLSKQLRYLKECSNL